MSPIPGSAKRFARLFEHRAWLSFVLGGVILASTWIFVPVLYDPYVRIPASEVTFQLDCLTDSLDITVRTPYAVARQARVRLRAAGNLPAVEIPAHLQRGSPESTAPEFFLGLETNDRTKLLSRVSPQQPAAFEYSFLFDRVPSIDLDSLRLTAGSGAALRCVGKTYKGEALLKIQQNSQATVMHYKLLQEEVGNLLLAFNNSVANFVLAGMLVALLWYGFILGGGALCLFTFSDATLRQQTLARIKKLPPELSGQGGAEVVKADFSVLNRRLQFAKTIGPALGFILTVSSLSAALHPAVQASQDTFKFISGIQIAVVATFVGLAIRIVAQFAQRMHRDLAERKLVALGETPEPTNTVAHESKP